jgi:hypothetical protein
MGGKKGAKRATVKNPISCHCTADFHFSPLCFLLRKHLLWAPIAEGRATPEKSNRFIRACDDCHFAAYVLRKYTMADSLLTEERQFFWWHNFSGGKAIRWQFKIVL